MSLFKFVTRVANLWLAFYMAVSIPLSCQAAEINCAQYLRQGLYLKFYDCSGTGTDLISIHNRSMALSFLGKEQEAQVLFDQSAATGKIADSKESPSPEITASQWQARPAIPFLAKLATRYTVVMLNEAHHISQHRLFALELAKELRRIGFTHLAVEGLTRPESGNRVEKIDLDSGFYTSDPEFAYFLNEALAMGFQLIAYEAADTSSINEREIGQAKNLKAFLDTSPGVKVFVYAGYAHITKNDSDKRKGWMAKEFKRLTGIDPLTIDQVSGTPSPYKVLRDPVWLAMQSRLLPGVPTLFIQDENTWLTATQWHGMVDLAVFFPEDSLQFGRANWLAKGRIRHTVKYSHNENSPLVIRARRKNEQDSVPVDQVMMPAGSGEANLFLPEGDYMIEEETLSRSIVHLYDLKLKKDLKP